MVKNAIDQLIIAGVDSAEIKDRIIEDIWNPIRKWYRLNHNLDVCASVCKVRNALYFSFLVWEPYEEKEVRDDSGYVYQELTRRENIHGDIADSEFNSDPKKVRMRYVAKDEYEKDRKARQQNRNPSKKRMVRKMPKPSAEEINANRKKEIQEFKKALRKFFKDNYQAEKPIILD